MGNYIIGIIISAIISSIISVILSDKIIFGIESVFIHLRIYRPAKLTGTWKATFIIGHGKNKTQYTDTILLKKRFGTIYGYICDSASHHSSSHPIRTSEMPLRLKSTLSDNRYLTGMWYHKEPINRYHGSFQLLIDPSFTKMRGQWIGFSEKEQIIDGGSWTWERIDK